MTSPETCKRRYRRVQHYKDPGVSLTEQHHARSCDINTIMAKYTETGVIEHMKKHEPNYGDVSEIDFKRSMDLVAAATSEFEELPAYVRAYYGQDVAAYLEAMETDEGREELRKLKSPASAYNRDGSRDTEALEASKRPPEASEQSDQPTEEGDKGVT